MNSVALRATPFGWSGIGHFVAGLAKTLLKLRLEQATKSQVISPIRADSHKLLL
jgi:hypothetical protein